MKRKRILCMMLSVFLLMGNAVYAMEETTESVEFSSDVTIETYEDITIVSESENLATEEETESELAPELEIGSEKESETNSASKVETEIEDETETTSEVETETEKESDTEVKDETEVEEEEELQPVLLSSYSLREAEPNDSMGMADVLAMGNDIGGIIASSNDVDFFRISLTSSGRLNLNVTSYMKYYSIHIYDVYNNDIWSSTYNYWNENIGRRTDSYYIDLTKGTYYIRIDGAGTTGSYNIAATFRASQETYAEPNNSMEKSKGVGFGNKIRGQIAVNDDKDFYRMVIPSSGRVKINILSYMEYYSVYLYDDTGKEIWSSTGNYWNSNVSRRVDNHYIDLTKGTYYIAFIKSNGRTGNYNFTTYFTASKETYAEPNDGIQQAKGVGFGNKIRGQLAINDDKDFYRMVLPSAGRVRLNILSYMEYYSVYLYDNTGKEIWSSTGNYWNPNTSSRGDNHYIDLTRGTYYIAFTKSNGRTGNYNFTTYFTASGETYAEPNNVMSQAKGVGFNTKIRGHLAINDDMDYFRLRLPSDCNIKINLMAYMENYELHIYTGGGAEVYSSTYNPWSSNVKYSNKGHYVFLRGGTYYIQVLRRYDTTGNYNFTISK